MAAKQNKAGRDRRLDREQTKGSQNPKQNF